MPKNIKTCEIWKSSLTLHGNALQKWKTSLTLHGNTFFVHMVQVGLPKRIPKKRPKPLVSKCFWSFLEPHWSTRVAHTQKWSSPRGSHRVPKAIVQSIHFSNIVWRCLPLTAAIGAPLFFDSFWKYAKRHWFYKYFGRPHWGHIGPPKGTSKIEKRAPR